MSAVKLNTPSGGSISLAPTNTASNLTITVPAVTGTMGMDGPAFSAYMSTATQSFSNGVFTKVAINTEEFDTNSCYDTGVYRFTPTVAGYYQVNGQISWGATTAADLIITIYKNGSRFKDGVNPRTQSGPYNTVSALIYCNGTTDYVELWGFQNTGGALNINGGTGYFTYFQAAMVRAA